MMSTTKLISLVSAVAVDFNFVIGRKGEVIVSRKTRGPCIFYHVTECPLERDEFKSLYWDEKTRNYQKEILA